MSETLPKKQFKSQSVNSLFRQQTTTKTDSKDIRKTSRSPTPTTTKLKLVSRKKPSLLKKKSPTPSSEGSPAPLDKTDSETLSSSVTSASDKEQQPSGSTSSTPENTTTATTSTEPQTESLKEAPKDKLATDVPSAFTQTPSGPLQVNYGQRNLDFADQDEWSDIQSQISTQTNSPQIVPKSNGLHPQSERFATYSPEGTRSWSSPNSKISSFRRSVATPMIHSLSQSPLSKPVDGPFPNSETLMNSTPMSIFPNRMTESRANTIGPQSLAVDTAQWSSPTIWNTEDRHLSTKSDSALAGSWSPFDMESLSLDDPFKMQSSHMSISFDRTQPRQASQTVQSRTESRSGSKTSRFFPSPVVEQNPSFDHFPRQPSVVERSPAPFQSMAPPTFNLFQSQQQQQQHQQQQPFQPQLQQQLPPHQQFQPPLNSPRHDFGFQGRQLFQENVFPSPTDTMPIHREEPEARYSTTSEPPLTFQNSSQKMDLEVFPESFKRDLSQVPISLFQPPHSDPAQYQPYHRRPVSYDQQAYPEGFSSTFYKRGNNNFMFIRELQPKLITSKHRDTVEVRVSFPSSKMDDEDDDKDAMIKMRCHIVNVDVKELEGKIAGIKVSKSGGNATRTRGSGRGYHRGHGRR